VQFTTQQHIKHTTTTMTTHTQTTRHCIS